MRNRNASRSSGQIRPSTFSDLGRALGISRQAAHRLACAAEREREIELQTHPCDRRIQQLALTPFGRRTLEAARAEERMWVTALLYDLEPRDMRRTTHILRVIRQRLLRNERKQRASRAGAGRGASGQQVRSCARAE